MRTTMITKRTIRCAAPALLATLGFLLVPAPSMAALEIAWFTIDSGGATTSVGGTLTLGGTAGQPDAGVLTGGTLTLSGGFWKGGALPAAVDGEATASGLAFRIHPGAPNPFSTSTRIVLELPEARSVRARIYDPSGRVVKRLFERTLPAGRYEFPWNGTDDDGHRLACGVYLLAVSAGDTTMRRSLVLVE